VFRVDNGYLIQLANPSSVQWYAEGRKATRAEILESIETGLPLLRDMAQRQSPEAEAELERMLAKAMKFVPAS
jgi:protein-disulfide isomerase-like protein with CxxC motif